MDEQPKDTEQPEAPSVAPKAWVTPVLIFEEISEITQGGTGGQPVFGGENKVTTYYHS
jgi:hypothetical protein